jgi:hypothetical protein
MNAYEMSEKLVARMRRYPSFFNPIIGKMPGTSKEIYRNPIRNLGEF